MFSEMIHYSFCQCLSCTFKYLSFFKDSYRTLASNLSTTTDNLLECGREALGLAANEYVTDIKLQFAEVGEGFHSVTSPTVTVTVLADLPDNTNVAVAGILVQIGNNIRTIRMGQGLSLEELSGRCGIGAAPLSKLERGESNATIQTLDRVAKGLGVSLVELVDIREYRTGKLDENAWLDLQRQMGKLSPQQQGDILAFIRMVAKWEQIKNKKALDRIDFLASAFFTGNEEQLKNRSSSLQNLYYQYYLYSITILIQM